MRELDEFKLFKGKLYKFNPYRVGKCFEPWRLMAYGQCGKVVSVRLRKELTEPFAKLHFMLQKAGCTQNRVPITINMKFE